MSRISYVYQPFIRSNPPFRFLTDICVQVQTLVRSPKFCAFMSGHSCVLQNSRIFGHSPDFVGSFLISYFRFQTFVRIPVVCAFTWLACLHQISCVHEQTFVCWTPDCCLFFENSVRPAPQFSAFTKLLCFLPDWRLFIIARAFMSILSCVQVHTIVCSCLDFRALVFRFMCFDVQHFMRSKPQKILQSLQITTWNWHNILNSDIF